MDEMARPVKTGTVVAVCISPARDFPKFPQLLVHMAVHGIVGDAHAVAPINPVSGTRVVRYLRAVSIVADEVRQDLNATLGLQLQPGQFNENLLVAGLGDLSDIEAGDRLLLSGGVILEVTAQNFPCTKLQAFTCPGIIQATSKKVYDDTLMNRRGLVAAVVQSGPARPGETVILERDQPKRS
jgi:hypothetical protein